MGINQAPLTAGVSCDNVNGGLTNKPNGLLGRNKVVQGVRREIQELLLSGIVTGEFPPNTRIPTEMELAKRFHTNRMNAHLAVKEIEHAGLVTRNKRKGTFVCRAIGREEADRVMARASRHVHALCFRGSATPSHWNDRTLQALEDTLNEKKHTLSYVDFSAQTTTRTALHKVIKNISQQGSAALVLLPDHTIRGNFLRDNVDLLGTYPGAIYFLNRGGRPIGDWPFHALSLDPFGDGLQIGRRLRFLQRSPVYFLAQPRCQDAYWLQERERGLTMGLDLPSATRTTQNTKGFAHFADYHKLCVRLKKRRSAKTNLTPTVVAANDECAVEFIEIAKDFELCPPRDFELIGFDNDPRHRHYGITTMAPPIERIGSTFAQLITNNFWGIGDGGTISIRFASVLIERETCRLDTVKTTTP